MNSLILSLFVAIVFIFHKLSHSSIKSGKVCEGFCALWCVDAVFAVCGTIISFVLYRYHFAPYFTVRNLLLFLVYFMITALFLLLAPSGISLLTKRRGFLEEELFLAEYRFNDTLCMVRSFFFALLFALPILLLSFTKSNLLFSLFPTWNEAEICGGFCFIAFLFLVPVSLRQAFFWLKCLSHTFTTEESLALKKYSMRLQYRQKNYRL